LRGQTTDQYDLAKIKLMFQPGRQLPPIIAQQLRCKSPSTEIAEPQPEAQPGTPPDVVGLPLEEQELKTPTRRVIIEEDSMQNYSLAELRREAKLRGLDSKGTKQQLRARLKTPSPTKASSPA
jgi:hypothetical protein